jgi:alanine racemase
VIKAEAYGHGLQRIAEALQTKVEMLAVARLHEAVELRENGIKAELLVLEGINDVTELAIAAHYKLQLVIHHSQQIEFYKKTVSASMKCWLKINTGMHRLGFQLDTVDQAINQLQACSAVLKIGLMTHLANADDPTAISVACQIQKMKAICQAYDFPKTIANSAGIIAWPDSHVDWVRPGLMIYGASPCQHRTAATIGLQPVMTLSAALLAIRMVQKGDQVGYGGHWQATKAGTLGIVGIGYGDGYPRQIDKTAQVMINQQRATIVGRISMDMLVIDLQGIQAKMGDRVILWGEGLPIEEVAAWANTIPYTLLSGVMPRVKRLYL